MWPNPQFPSNLVTFTEKTLNGKRYFCAVLGQPKKIQKTEKYFFTHRNVGIF